MLAGCLCNLIFNTHDTPLHLKRAAYRHNRLDAMDFPVGFAVRRPQRWFKKNENPAWGKRGFLMGL